jgi:hypothetical protein
MIEASRMFRLIPDEWQRLIKHLFTTSMIISITVWWKPKFTGILISC